MHLLLGLFMFAAFAFPPAAKTLSVLVIVYGVIQALKQATVLQPILAGWVAIVVNIVFSSIGVWIAVPADQFWAPNTFILILTTALGAAGVHGTVSAQTDATKPGPALSAPPAAPAGKIAALLLCAMAIGVVGCTNWERTTFQSLAASKAVIDQAQADYESGTLLPHDKAAYEAVNAAKLAQTTAVNAMVAYENVKASGGSSTALTTAQNVVIAALAEIPPLIAAIKLLYTTKTTAMFIQPRMTQATTLEWRIQ
jgi:hypothetical protein